MLKRRTASAGFFSQSGTIKRQGQFPVIYINFKEVKGSNYKEIVSSIIDQIIELYERFNYLEQYIQEDNKFFSIPQKVKLKNYLSGDINISYLKNSLKFLSQILYKHFKQKVYILIDEYDTPINNAYLELVLSHLLPSMMICGIWS